MFLLPLLSFCIFQLALMILHLPSTVPSAINESANYRSHWSVHHAKLLHLPHVDCVPPHYAGCRARSAARANLLRRLRAAGEAAADLGGSCRDEAGVVSVPGRQYLRRHGGYGSPAREVCAA